jgi:hypothetical protein
MVICTFTVYLRYCRVPARFAASCYIALWHRVLWLRWIWAKAVRRHMNAPESQQHIIKYIN